jgi:hypothetical protein
MRYFWITLLMGSWAAAGYGQYFTGTITNVDNHLIFKIKPVGGNITASISLLEFDLRYPSTFTPSFSGLSSNTTVFPGLNIVQTSFSMGGDTYQKFYFNTGTIPSATYVSGTEYKVFQVTLTNAPSTLEMATDYTSVPPTEYQFSIADGAGNPMIDPMGSSFFFPAQQNSGTDFFMELTGFPTTGYCLPAMATPCSTSGDYIDDVQFGTISNLNTGCANPQSNNYTNYTAISTPLNLSATYPITLQPGPSQGQYFVAMIDFNDDKDFADAGEFFNVGFAAAGGSVMGSITLPVSAPLGTKRLRILCQRGNNPITQAMICDNFTYGETEDYSVVITTPNCTTLSSPANGATNVAVTTALSWTAATGNPSGYRLNVGTTSGGTQILNNFDAGNVTTYDPPGNFPYNTTIYVKITPYNGNGSATGCLERSFTTQIAPPGCTTLSSPANNATNVAVTSALTWTAATGSPTGYRLNVGTTSGGTQILNNFDVGNVTTYNPAGDFPYNTTIYVTVIPYNGTGSASGCTQTSFTTQIAPPNCTTLSSPANNATNVAVTSALTWTAATGSPTGYRLNVGTTSGGTQILNNFDVGNVTTYNPPGDFPYNTTIYVTVIPYNGTGSASGCTQTSFTTQIAPPNCTTLSSPANNATNVAVTSALTWTAATGSPTGYRLNVGTTSGGTQILNNFDVGNVTTYNPPGDFPYNTTIYVTVIPYNGTGSAGGCTQTSFSTPVCTPNLTITADPVAAGTYQSSGELTSSNSSVATGTTVVFQSDTGITISSNFTVQLGGIFTAEIATCPTSSSKLGTPESLVIEKKE